MLSESRVAAIGKGVFLGANFFFVQNNIYVLDESSYFRMPIQSKNRIHMQLHKIIIISGLFK